MSVSKRNSAFQDDVIYRKNQLLLLFDIQTSFLRYIEKTYLILCNRKIRNLLGCNKGKYISYLLYYTSYVAKTSASSWNKTNIKKRKNIPNEVQKSMRLTILIDQIFYCFLIYHKTKVILFSFLIRTLYLIRDNNQINVNILVKGFIFLQDIILIQNIF